MSAHMRIEKMYECLIFGIRANELMNLNLRNIYVIYVAVFSQVPTKMLLFYR